MCQVAYTKDLSCSIYCGPDVDFGNGSRIFIDNLDAAEGIIEEFRPYFEDPDIKKVWHNYGFDRHILRNHNIDCQVGLRCSLKLLHLITLTTKHQHQLTLKGFAGDTMQMARLWDTSRLRGYSLESLSTDLLAAPKITIKDRFGKPKAKIDGSDAKEVAIPPLDELQRNRLYVKEWIDYSTYDTESTWQLRNVLEVLGSTLTVLGKVAEHGLDFAGWLREGSGEGPGSQHVGLLRDILASVWQTAD